jgi:hypothetical protein
MGLCSWKTSNLQRRHTVGDEKRAKGLRLCLPSFLSLHLLPLLLENDGKRQRYIYLAGFSLLAVVIVIAAVTASSRGTLV